MKLEVVLGLSIAVLAGTAGGARAQHGDLALAGAGGLGVQAGAGSPPVQSIRVVDPSIPVPSNGSILLMALDTEPDVVVYFNGVTLDGTVRHVTLDYWAWKADEPLPVGVVSVELPSSWGTTTAEVTVIEAMEIAPPPFSSMPHAYVTQVNTESRFCQRWTGDMLIDETVFATREVGQVYLDPKLETTASLALVHQFLYRAHMDDGIAGNHLPFGFVGFQVGPYVAQAEQYCFGFDAMDLTASAIHPYPEHTPRCAPHGDLPDLAERDVEVPNSALDRFVCQSPPDGFEDRWCDINRACGELAPEERNDGNGCLLYGHTCLGEALPLASQPPIVGGMTGGSQPPIVVPDPDPDPNDPSTGGTMAMAVDKESDGDPDEPQLVKSGCGCFVGARPDASSAAAPWWLALGALVIARRVLRRRPAR